MGKKKGGEKGGTLRVEEKLFHAERERGREVLLDRRETE